MDFEYSDEQKLFSETLRRFLATGYNFDARAKIIASGAGHSEDVWAALAEMGILGVPFDAEHGGFGGTTVDMMVVMEALGEALVVEPYLATVGLGGRFVVRAGTPAQQQRVLAALTQGKTKLAFAQTEAGARYNLARVGMRARPSGDGFTLEGEKTAVLHGGSADLLVVSARTAGGDADARGISLFLVECGAPGVAVTEYRTIDNLRVADIRFSNVAVSRDALLGAEGQALPVIEEVVDYATTLVCAEAVGAIKYAHDATLEYLKTRRQFGVPIGSFQALQHRMVDIYIAWEQARSIVCLACVKMDTADTAERQRAVSAAKIKIADAARHVSQEAVQLHGGMGMTEELKISHTFRRLTIIAQTFGDADHHLGRFATLERLAAAR
jgi:alkylation response protein AidB-like acyl-CoA dehydrogenase